MKRLVLALAGLLAAAAAPDERVVPIAARDGVPAHNLRVLSWPGAVPGPTLLYVPGWGGRADENARLASALAEAGYTVAAIDYAAGQPPGFAASAARLATAMDLATSDGVARTTAEGDWRAVLIATDATALLDSVPATGILGWSFGGAVAVQACRQDARLHACLNMDGWQFGPAADSPPRQPFMLLSGEPYPDAPHPARTPAATLDERDAARLRARFASAGGLYAQLDGRSHDDFGRADPVVRALVLAFFDSTLRGRPAPLLATEHPLPGVTLRRFPRPAG